MQCTKLVIHMKCMVFHRDVFDESRCLLPMFYQSLPSSALSSAKQRKPKRQSPKVNGVMAAIVNVTDAASFNKEVEKSRLTVVHFWASWAVQVSKHFASF